MTLTLESSITFPSHISKEQTKSVFEPSLVAWGFKLWKQITLKYIDMRNNRFFEANKISEIYIHLSPYKFYNCFVIYLHWFYNHFATIRIKLNCLLHHDTSTIYQQLLDTFKCSTKFINFFMSSSVIQLSQSPAEIELPHGCWLTHGEQS